MDLIWTEKYRPKTLTDYYIDKSNLDVIKTWITDFSKGDDYDNKPFLILYGTPGVGKTTLSRLILEKYGYEIIECNASDTRNKEQLKSLLGGITSVSVCLNNKNKFKSIAIIMDEIDGLSDNENGGVKEIIDNLISVNKNTKEIKSVCPVICTCNSIKEKKLQLLLKYAMVICVKRPSTEYIIKLINKICIEEHIILPNEEKENIIKNANGDYRQIINLLYLYYCKCKHIAGNSQNIIQNNIIQENINELDIPVNNIISKDTIFYNRVKNITNNTDSPLERINYFLTHHPVSLEIINYFCSGDSNLFFMNFYNNIINIVSTLQNKHLINTTNTSTQKGELLKYYTILYKIYELLKYGDTFNDPIFINKYWELMEYFDSYSVGFPCIILNGYNSNLSIQNFNITHHTQYNYMRQEQSIFKKKQNIDYFKTFDNNVINTYYNLKRFLNNNPSIKQKKTKPKPKPKKNNNNDEQKYQIDRSYFKIIEKIDELLE